MTHSPQGNVSRWIDRVFGVCAAVAVAISLGGIVGWSASAPLLTSYVPGATAINPTTAVALGAVCVALCLVRREQVRRRRRAVSRTLAAAVALLGAYSIAAYLFAIANPFDQLLFGSLLQGNRIAPNTALCLLFLGVALLALDGVGRGSVAVCQSAAAAAAIVSFLSVAGYAYGTRWLYGVPSFIPMALPTAIGVHALAMGIFCSRPRQGAMAAFTSNSFGGVMARRLAPAALAFPVGLGWTRLLGERQRLYDAELGVAIYAVTTSVGFLVLIWWCARKLNALDEARLAREDELWESAQRIEDLYNRAPCGYYSLDEAGMFVAANDTVLTWLGYVREEVVGKLRFPDLLTPAGREVFAYQFPIYKQTGSVDNLEFELARKDDTTFWVLLSSTAIRDADGKFVASRSTVFDITERKQAQAELQRLNEALEDRVEERTAALSATNRELRQKNDENEMFVYSVSHDLRAPLVNLQGFSQELAASADELAALWQANSASPAAIDRTLEILDEDVRPSLRFIQSGVMRLSTIIDALLRLSRAGRVEYQWERVEVAEIVVRIVDSLQLSIAEKRASIHVGELQPAWGDAAALEQIFGNLLANAVNYLDASRPGVIEVGSLPSADGDAGFVTYRVKDNGVGIPALHQAKVFQAFQRLQPNLASGEGMGLTMTRRIIERHRGRIWLESVEGEGTEFLFTLPAAPAEGRAETSAKGDLIHAR